MFGGFRVESGLVYNMAAAGRVRAWKDLLSRNTIIPSNSDREKTQSDVSTPFAVSIKNVEGLLSQVNHVISS